MQERYEQVVPLLKQILASDAFNLDALMRLATAYSSLGRTHWPSIRSGVPPRWRRTRRT